MEKIVFNIDIKRIVERRLPNWKADYIIRKIDSRHLTKIIIIFGVVTTIWFAHYLWVNFKWLIPATIKYIKTLFPFLKNIKY